jgi:hypothetical protein
VARGAVGACRWGFGGDGEGEGGQSVPRAAAGPACHVSGWVVVVVVVVVMVMVVVDAEGGPLVR